MAISEIIRIFDNLIINCGFVSVQLIIYCIFKIFFILKLRMRWCVPVNEDQLATFITVANCLNYSRAAEQLMVTQPTVTARIHSLELELNCKLFHKLGKNISLTREGKALYDYAEKMLHIAEQAKKTIAAINQPKIRLAFSPGFSLRTILDTLYTFQSRYNISIELSEGDATPSVIAQVLNGEIDLGFIKNQEDIPGLISEPILDDKLVLIVSRQHRLAALEEISNSDLIGETYICLNRPGSFLELIEERLKEIPDLRRIDVSNKELVFSMVKDGYGFGLISSLAIFDDDGDWLCVKPFRTIESIPNRIIAVYRDRDQSRPNILSFVQFYKEALEQLDI